MVEFKNAIIFVSLFFISSSSCSLALECGIGMTVFVCAFAHEVYSQLQMVLHNGKLKSQSQSKAKQNKRLNRISRNCLLIESYYSTPCAQCSR